MTLDEFTPRILPFEHQIVGTKKLLENPFFALFDQMGVGKSKQVIDAAQMLFVQGFINTVIVVCPASVRSVWFDRELGELSKHLWENLPSTILEYHGKSRTWRHGPKRRDIVDPLEWIVTNYDFIRPEERRKYLYIECGPKTLLVLDESSAIKNYKAKQTKACWDLRKKCGRVVLLNGTPIPNNPGDLFSQANMMHPSILECKSYFQFRARYAVMGGYMNKQIVQWRWLEDLQKRLAPHVIRRLKTECLDLPPKLPPVVLSVPLTSKTWGIYKEMRDELVAWLSNSKVSTAQQAVVKVIRLAQITSGFVGGVSPAIIDDPDSVQETYIEEISHEKLDLFAEILEQHLAADPKAKILVWCRFRAELQRVLNYLTVFLQNKGEFGAIWGGQKREERERALRLLDPRTTPDCPVVVVGTPSSGSMGLNLTAAHTVIYLSNDYSLKTRLQSEDRVHRPGQMYPVSYFDIVATGPQGQKTVDHAVIKALQKKEELANWTTGAWITALREE